jgi:hypothetical protein
MQRLSHSPGYEDLVTIEWRLALTIDVWGYRTTSLGVHLRDENSADRLVEHRLEPSLIQRRALEIFHSLDLGSQRSALRIGGLAQGLF